MDDFINSKNRIWVSPLINLREMEIICRSQIQTLKGLDDSPFFKNDAEKQALVNHAMFEEDLQEKTVKKSVQSYTKFFTSLKGAKKSLRAKYQGSQDGNQDDEEFGDKENENESSLDESSDDNESSHSDSGEADVKAKEELNENQWTNALKSLDKMTVSNLLFVNEYENATAKILKPGASLRVKDYISSEEEEPPIIDKIEEMSTHDSDEFPESDDETEAPNIKLNVNEIEPRPGTSKQALIQRFLGVGFFNAVAKREENEQNQEIAIKKEKTQDDLEFEEFREYSEMINKERAKGFINPAIRKDLMTELKLDNSEFKNKKRLFDISKCMTNEDPIIEKPVMKDGYMPLLAGPLSEESLKKLGSIAMYKFVSEEIGNFQWKSLNVHEQMTNDRKVKQRVAVQRMRIPYDFENETDIILNVSVFKNVKYDDTVAEEFALNPEPTFAFELEICGEDSLMSLRNKICCEGDYVSIQDVEDPFTFKKSDAVPFYAKHQHTQFSFFIENQFFVDPSCSTSVEYANKVIEWLKKPGHWSSNNINYGIKNALDMKIKDLVICFGKPYLFTHLGECEHLIVFSQACMKTRMHPPSSEYPMYSKVGHFKVLNCRVDNELIARWSVVGCERFPENPMLLCDYCLKSFCYDKKRNKIGDFKVFPLTHLAHEL